MVVEHRITRILIFGSQTGKLQIGNTCTFVVDDGKDQRIYIYNKGVAKSNAAMSAPGDLK